MSEEKKEKHITLLQIAVELNRAKLDDFEIAHSALVNSTLPPAHTANAVAISMDNITHVKGVIASAKKGIAFLSSNEAGNIEWSDVVAEMDSSGL